MIYSRVDRLHLLLMSNLMWPGWFGSEMDYFVWTCSPQLYTLVFLLTVFYKNVCIYSRSFFFFFQQGNCSSTHPSQAWAGLCQLKPGPGIWFLNKEMQQLRPDCPFSLDGVSEGTIGLLEGSLPSLSCVFERVLADKNKPGAFLTRRQSRFLYSSGKSSGNHPPDCVASSWPCATHFSSPVMPRRFLLAVPPPPSLPTLSQLGALGSSLRLWHPGPTHGSCISSLPGM